MPSNKKLSGILSKIYYSLGKSGAFYSAKKIQNIIWKEKKIKVKESAIQDWLEGELAYSLHRNRRKNFKRNPVIATGIDENWQADIGFLTKYKRFNFGFSCFLAVIDVLSKYAWVEPLKSKDGPETTKAFERILFRAKPRLPLKLQTDKGKEFFNKKFKALMKSRGIGLYSTESDKKAAVAERFIKTMKTLILRYFSSEQSFEWVSKIQQFVSTYNNTLHKSIKMTPSEASNEKNEGRVIQNLYGFMWAEDNLKKRLKFEVGDFVRVSKADEVFRKGYEGLWSEKIFKISSIRMQSFRPMYELSNLNGEKISGFFYEHELARVKMKEDTYWRVEKILRKKFVKGKLMYLVKFLNYDEPEWISAEKVSNVEKVKKLLK